MKGKIEKSAFTKEWTGDKGTIYYHLITVNGVEGQIGSKQKEPSFLAVGQEIEVEVSEGKYGKVFKRVQPQGYGGKGRKPIMVKQEEALRMCRSNAIHAMCVVNAAYNEERIKANEIQPIIAFTSENIKGDFEKFGELDQDLTSRLAAVNNAVIQASYKRFNSVEDVLAVARGIYKFVKG